MATRREQCLPTWQAVTRVGSCLHSSRKAKKTSEPDRNVTALSEVQISVAQVGLRLSGWLCTSNCRAQIAVCCPVFIKQDHCYIQHTATVQCHWYNRIPQSAVVKTWTAHSVSMDAREIWVRFQSGAHIFPFSTVPNSSLRLIQRPSPNLEHKADHLPPQCEKVETAWSCIYTSPYVVWLGASSRAGTLHLSECLTSYRDITFILMLN